MIFTHWALLHLPTPALCNLADAVTGDRLNDILAVWHNDCATLVRRAMNTDEARSRELVNLRSCPAVQMQSNAEALLLCLSTMPQDWCVVATDFRTASALGSSAIKVLQNQSCDWMHTVVDSSGHDVYDEHVLFWWIETKLSTGAKEQWSNVHACASAMRWDELGIQADSQVNRLLEQIDWNFRHADVGSRMLHTFGILLRSKDANGVVSGASGCLKTLIALHAVVQTRCHSV